MSVDLDRLKQAFDQAVEYALPQVDYHALYACQVVAQNADGSLDLMPARADWPSQKKIPFRCGIPGVTITVGVGAQVLLGWQNGDPSAPYAALWLPGSPGDLEDLTINAAGTIKIGAGATLAAARVTDPVAAAPSMQAFIAQVIAGFAAVPSPSVVAPPTDFGTIEQGSTKVEVA